MPDRIEALKELAQRELRRLRGWVCFHIVVRVPITLRSPVYCWALGWAGWYAHGGDAPSLQPGERQG